MPFYNQAYSFKRSEFKAKIITLPHKDNLPWNIDWIMLEAQK